MRTFERREYLKYTRLRVLLVIRQRVLLLKPRHQGSDGRPVPIGAAGGVLGSWGFEYYGRRAFSARRRLPEAHRHRMP
jgi:hypothetical protein